MSISEPITPSGTALPPSASPKIPPLESGDHLTSQEFEHRYLSMPHLKKAELIEGAVHMPSPVRWKRHAVPHADLIGWLVFYRAYTPFVQVGGQWHDSSGSAEYPPAGRCHDHRGNLRRAGPAQRG
jgi:hypothetical protein